MVKVKRRKPNPTSAIDDGSGTVFTVSAGADEGAPSDDTKLAFTEPGSSPGALRRNPALVEGLLAQPAMNETSLKVIVYFVPRGSVLLIVNDPSGVAM